MYKMIIIVSALFFLSMVLIGVYGKRYAKTFQSFINMDKKGNVLMLTGACVGSNIGNGFVVGGAGKGSVIGLAGSAFGLSCACTALVAAVFLTDFICKNNYSSLAEYTKGRYKSELPGVIYVIATLFSYLGVFGVQLQAGKVLFEVLGINKVLGTIVVAAVVFAYSQLAGVWGAFMTSTVQTIIIILGLLLTASEILLHGGLMLIQEGIVTGSAPAGALDFSGVSASGFCVMAFPILLSMVTGQDFFVRISTAKDVKTARNAHLLSFFVMIPLAIIPALIGVYGRTRYGISGDGVFFTVILNDLPTITAAVIMVAVLSAVMSTIGCVYSTIDTVVVCDLLRGTMKKELSEKKLKRIVLLLNLGLTVFAVLLSLRENAILDVLNEFYSLLAAACFVPFVGGILYKKGTAVGASAAAIAGILCVVVTWFGVSLPSVVGLFPHMVAAFVFLTVSCLPIGKSTSSHTPPK